MKKFLINRLFGGYPQGERLPPPTMRTVQPDSRPSQYFWFHMTHASAQWAKDYHFKEAIINYLKKY